MLLWGSGPDTIPKNKCSCFWASDGSLAYSFNLDRLFMYQTGTDGLCLGLPKMPERFSVPARSKFSWPPPVMRGVSLKDLRQTRRPIPLGAWILWPLKATAVTPDARRPPSPRSLAAHRRMARSAGHFGSSPTASSSQRSPCAPPACA